MKIGPGAYTTACTTVQAVI